MSVGAIARKRRKEAVFAPDALYAPPGRFARGIGLYKLVWVFTAGSVLGFVVETIFCVIIHGHVESRQGMVFGPFSQIYGIGAVVMTMLLVPLRHKGPLFVYLMSGVLGGTIEFCSSFLQETLFASRSWDYSGDAFSIAGRTSPLFIAFWCILGFLFVWWVYPWFSRAIEGIPARVGTILTWGLIVLFLADAALSATAVNRWIERNREIPAQTRYAELLDRALPDTTMRLIYPRMRFVDDDMQATISEP